MHYMADTADAHLGLWRDYSRPPLSQWQILATDFLSRWMTAFVAVCLTLTSPYVFKIGKSFLLSLFDLLAWLAREWKGPNPADLADSSVSPNLNGAAAPLLGNPKADYGTTPQASSSERPKSPKGKSPEDEDSSGSSSGSRTITDQQTDSSHGRKPSANILSHAGDSRETVWRFIQHLLHRGSKEVKSPSIAMVVITTVLFGLFVAQAVAGVFSAKIASDRIGLSSSNHCGIWQFDDNAGDEPGYRDDLKNYKKEARASQYARNCYTSPDSTSTLTCRIFYNQSIAFTTKTQQRCPFASPSLCLDGLYSAITFDTGLVDSSIIGINAGVTHKFRRSTTCSPVNMSEPYIEGPVQGVKNDTYRYNYGSKDDVDHTFQTSGQPLEWLVPVYSVNTYFSSLYPEVDYWKPIEGLKQPEHSTLTIMFVSSMHIYHTEASYDPIFPATEPAYFEDYREPFYYNAEPRARVLACVDTTELCSPDGATCWSMTAPVPPNIPSTPAYWLTKWSLENSNTYDSIKWRLGTALLAQESISQFVSTPLSREQWQIEAGQLFATSLANIQYDAWGIATGEDRDRPGYIDVTPDEAKGRLCKMYKFRTADYTNINLLAFVGLPLLAITIFVFSWDAATVGLSTAAKGDNKSLSLVIDVIAKFFYTLVAVIIVFIIDMVRFLSGKPKEWIQRRREQRHVSSDEPDSEVPVENDSEPVESV